MQKKHDCYMRTTMHTGINEPLSYFMFAYLDIICVFCFSSYPLDISSSLRNEFNFWSVHEIMTTLGLLQSK